MPSGYPPSILELTFKPKGKETELTMVHSKVPVAQSKMYSEGWMMYLLGASQKILPVKEELDPESALCAFLGNSDCGSNGPDSRRSSPAPDKEQ